VHQQNGISILCDPLAKQIVEMHHFTLYLHFYAFINYCRGVLILKQPQCCVVCCDDTCCRKTCKLCQKEFRPAALVVRVCPAEYLVEYKEDISIRLIAATSSPSLFSSA
jgi:hypothetical protein